MEILSTSITNAICSDTLNITGGKLFFHRITGGIKYALTKEEYQILTNVEDLQMFIFYQYLIYIIYRGTFPDIPYHFKYVKRMLSYIETKRKQVEQQNKKDVNKEKEKKDEKKLIKKIK